MAAARTGLESHTAEELTELRGRVQALAAAVCDSFAVIRRGCVIETTERFAADLGFRSGELLGRRIAGHLPKPTRRLLLRKLRCRDATPARISLRRRDDRLFPAEICVVEIPRRGQSAWLVTMRDVSSRIAMQRRLIEMADEKQRQIGSDLHDDLGQRLTGISLGIESLRKSLERDRSPHAGRARDLASLIQDAIQHTRYLGRNLAPVVHRSGGLSVPLRQLAAEVARIDGMRCDYRYRCTLTPSPVLATHLYRIAQEAVHNAVKHAGASRITIDCRSSGNRLQLRVSDDGRGLPGNVDELSGMGIKTMHHRAEVVGATLLIESPRGGGTEVLCRCEL